MNRRNAIAAFIAGIGSLTLWPIRAKCDGLQTIVNDRIDTGPFLAEIKVVIDDAKLREHIRGLYDPEYIPEVQGVLGKTYFKAGVEPQIRHTKLRCYFDGTDVHGRTSEADAVGGWARLYDVDGACRKLPRQRTHFGKVEFKEPHEQEIHYDRVNALDEDATYVRYR